MTGISMAANTAAQRANAACFCITLERSTLIDLLDLQTGSDGFGDSLVGTHPYLFAASPVFLTAPAIAEMRSIVAAIEAAIALPQFHAATLNWAPPIAMRDFGPAGAMMGYDFHLANEGPRLIEINTNAGGAFLNAVLAKAQRTCCDSAADVERTKPTDTGFEDRVVSMFRSEWTRQGRTVPLKTIAIIDVLPREQHLFPEFLLAKAVLERHGIETIIADPQELTSSAAGVSIGDRPIDLIYNRLVDFMLDEPRHDQLQAAYLSGQVVVTPNPYLHVRYANKRNLALLSDMNRLSQWGLPTSQLELLRNAVPRTVVVKTQDADSLWADRRNLFFKPAQGYASKAAYYGGKLTKKVWQEILKGDYIAQAYTPPGKRRVIRDGIPVELKTDIRLYTYGGGVLLTTARLYQGQTTNMRTPGGGFAPVLELEDERGL